jgi:hypothetical protein
LRIGPIFEEIATIRKSVDHELGSPILSPRSLAVANSDGPFFPVTNGSQSIGANIQVDKEIFNRFSASFAQSDIVGIRSAIIAMPFNSNPYLRSRQPVLAFSKKFVAQIEHLREKHYRPGSASVNHIVYWRKEGAEREVKVVLPEISFERSG